MGEVDECLVGGGAQGLRVLHVFLRAPQGQLVARDLAVALPTCQGLCGERQRQREKEERKGGEECRQRKSKGGVGLDGRGTFSENKGMC